MIDADENEISSTQAWMRRSELIADLLNLASLRSI